MVRVKNEQWTNEASGLIQCPIFVQVNVVEDEMRLGMVTQAETGWPECKWTRQKQSETFSNQIIWLVPESEVAETWYVYWSWAKEFPGIYI